MSNKRRNLFDKATYYYIKNLKKWMFCPACQKGKMTFNKNTSQWVCEDCGYSFSEEYFLDDCIFWFCDECNHYLNNQEGFDKKAKTHICRICGYENDITENNLGGVCSVCGKNLPNPDATLCVDCREARREKAKQWLKTAGTVAAVATAVLSAAALTSSSDDSEGCNGCNGENVGYGLGDDYYPTCKTCGTLMTDFDGCTWYTCPSCGNRVRIIDGVEKWEDEIFKQGKKELRSDYDLADFCRGGDLKED